MDGYFNHIHKWRKIFLENIWTVVDKPSPSNSQQSLSILVLSLISSRQTHRKKKEVFSWRRMADPHEDFQNGDLTIVVEDATKKNENESESEEDAGSPLDKRQLSTKSNKSVSFQEDSESGQDQDESEAPAVRSGHFSQRRISRRISMRSFRFSSCLFRCCKFFLNNFKAQCCPCSGRACQQSLLKELRSWTFPPPADWWSSRSSLSTSSSLLLTRSPTSCRSAFHWFLDQIFRILDDWTLFNVQAFNLLFLTWITDGQAQDWDEYWNEK